MKDQEKRTLLNKIADWLGLGATHRAIKDVEAWDGAASNYSSTEAYCNACLINVNAGDPEDWTQANCKLPIREEGDGEGTYVRQAVFAAVGGRGITAVEKPADVSQEDWDSAVMSAASKLVQAYDEMEEDAPESVTEIARALSSSQLWTIVSEQLEEMYEYDYWPMDIYFDDMGMPFVVVAVDGKLYRHSIILDEDMSTVSEAIPVMQEFIPTARTTTTIKRMDSGRWRWFSVSASSVLNRVGEIDSRDLFDSFVTHAEETGEYPIRQFYHAGDAFRVGQADFLARDDNLYITSGLYDQSEIAEREIRARLKEPEYWGDSIGYIPTDRPEMLEIAKGVKIPVYRAGVNKEISTLPERDAANLFTANTNLVRRTMTLVGKSKEAFIKLFDGNEDEADRWLEEHAETRNRAIEDDDLITRAGKEVTEVKEIEQEIVEQEIVNELSDEDIARALGQSESMRQLVATIDSLVTQLEANEQAGLQRQKQLTDQLQKMADRLEALEADDEVKQREWLDNRPRQSGNNVKYIIRPRIERAAEDEQKMSVADVMAAKGVPNY